MKFGSTWLREVTLATVCVVVKVLEVLVSDVVKLGKLWAADNNVSEIKIFIAVHNYFFVSFFSLCVCLHVHVRVSVYYIIHYIPWNTNVACLCRPTIEVWLTDDQTDCEKSVP